MKKNRRIITLILVAGMLLSFASCTGKQSSGDESTSDAPETTDGAGVSGETTAADGALEVAKQEYTFTKLGETDVLSATVGGVSVYDVGYTSGDESVAAVVGNAVVAMGSGMTTITATRGSDTVVITVNVNTFSKVVIAGDDMVPLNTASNPTAALTAAVEVPTVFDKTDAGVTWTSSNPEVATVDADGNVTAVGTGVAVITASSNYQITTTTVQSMMGMSITSTDTAIADDKVVVMVNNEFDAEKNKEIIGTYTGHYDWQGFAAQASEENPCYTKDNFLWIRSKIILELKADGTFTQKVLNAQRATYPDSIDDSLPESTYEEQVAKYGKNNCYIYNRADQDPTSEEFAGSDKTYATIEGMEASGMRNFAEIGYFMVTGGELKLYYGVTNGMTGEYQSEEFDYGKIEGNEFVNNEYVPFVNMVKMSGNMTQVLTKSAD